MIRPSLAAPFAAALAACVLAVTPAAAAGATDLNGASATSVEIARPVEQVWGVLMDRTRWQKTYAGKTVLAGTAGQVGEVSRIELKLPDGRVGARIEEIMLLKPRERMVVRLASPEGITGAFADFRLFPAGKGTRMEMTVHWFEPTPEGTPADALPAMKATYAKGTQDAIEGHMRVLKEAAETPPSKPAAKSPAKPKASH